MVGLSSRSVKSFCEPPLFFEDLFFVIRNAKKFVYVEFYKVEGVVGVRLRDLLVRKAKEGVVVKVLVDYWGSSIPRNFFDELLDAGGEVRFFRVFMFATNFFSYNNRRNHRKLVVVDDFCFIGSCNVSDHCKSWREFVVRIRDPVFSESMRSVFLTNFRIHSFFFHSAKKHLSPLRFGSFEVVRDVPSLRYQKIRNKHLYLINRAKERVVIETPYFVPDTKTLIALIRAARRGVDVSVIVPERSDVRLVDILTQSLFGVLHKRGVKIFLFGPGFSHAKVFLADDFFGFGSSNFDYRSFRYQYDLSLFGDDRVLHGLVDAHLRESFKSVEAFDFKKWRGRSLFRRLLEVMLEPFRRFF